MTRNKYMVIVLATVLTSAIGWQSTVHSHEIVEQESSSWSVGAGVSLHSVYQFTLAGLASRYPVNYGGYGTVYNPGFNSAPEGLLMVDYGLSQRVGLMFLASGFYTKPEWDDDGDFSGFGVSAGVRWSFNPGASVEVSSYGLLSYDRVWYTSASTSVQYNSAGNILSTTTKTYDNDAYTVGAGIGLAFEIGLLGNLRLRFSSLLARVAYGHGEWTNASDESNEDKGSNNGFLASLEFTPSIQLRMLF